MDPRIAFVLENMRMVVEDNEGAVVEFVSFENGVLTVRYEEGTNEECPECVMPPDAFRELLLDALKAQNIEVKEVRLV